VNIKNLKIFKNKNAPVIREGGIEVFEKVGKTLLIVQATELYKLGLEVEAVRAALKELVESGVSFDDPQIYESYERFEELNSEWERLEAEHLRMRKEFGLK